jgi:GxxExxY protein
MQSSQPLAEEGFALMGAAFAVHNEIGGGLSEEIYHESLAIELQLRKIPHTSKVQFPVFYKGHQISKTYIPDLITHGKIVVELKAVSKLLPEHESQLINYLRIAKKPIGYLINLAPIKEVEWKRFLLSEFL